MLTERNIKRKRIFSISGNNRGLACPFMPIVCQEGCCKQCQIYLTFFSILKGEEMKSTQICDDEGIVCTICGKDVYHCECPDGNAGQGKVYLDRQKLAERQSSGCGVQSDTAADEERSRGISRRAASAPR